MLLLVVWSGLGVAMCAGVDDALLASSAVALQAVVRGVLEVGMLRWLASWAAVTAPGKKSS